MRTWLSPMQLRHFFILFLFLFFFLRNKHTLITLSFCFIFWSHDIHFVLFFYHTILMFAIIIRYIRIYYNSTLHINRDGKQVIKIFHILLYFLLLCILRLHVFYFIYLLLLLLLFFFVCNRSFRFKNLEFGNLNNYGPI